MKCCEKGRLLFREGDQPYQEWEVSKAHNHVLRFPTLQFHNAWVQLQGRLQITEDKAGDGVKTRNTGRRNGLT